MACFAWYLTAASLVVGVHAAVEEFRCIETEVSVRLLGGLNKLASASAYADPSLIESLTDEDLTLLASDLQNIEAYLRSFGRHVPAGIAGWSNLFDPLQGCPFVFVAAELALGFGIWSSGGRVRKDWFKPGMHATLPFEQRMHFARAVGLVGAWRTWLDLAPRPAFTGGLALPNHRLLFL
eukprot:TRINITY_DN60969_c0_g1_i1.p1 TRINITY_DN60969_c0_g1~~TRINITY_DN60969_c0_g1_i1.p1  ORF type:complete len:180 (+),score=31.56 TRINITY_DN60969_c0_g1_i1:47-586(+)